MAYLILHIPGRPQQRTMLSGRTVIGRAFGSNLWIDDPRLSRTHCIVEAKEGRWFVFDARSSNGTFVNAKRIEQHALSDGDTIELGRVRIGYCEGNFVEHRPADPVEAAMEGMGRIPLGDSDPATATVTGEPIIRRPLPFPQPQIVHPQPRQMPAVPLPFTRPPARPIVHHQPVPAGPKMDASDISSPNLLAD